MTDLTPREIVAELDRFIIGQDDAKRAVAVALHAWTGPGAPEDYRLLVPGGEIGVHVGADPLGEDGSVLLTGPATITGRVTVV